MLTLFLSFSVYAICADILGDINGDTIIGLSSIGMYGSQNGYTIVNFALMYIVGAFIRLNEEELLKISRKKLLFGMVILVALDSLWYLIFEHFKFENNTSHSYLNPIVIMLAALAFILFKQINLGHRRIINALAKGSFTVFLTHNYLLPYIRIEQFVNKSLPLLIVHILLSVVVIYIICWVVYFVYESATAPIYRIIDKKFDKATYTVN